VDHGPVSHRQSVNCTTCGRDNPGHLIFCQECGQKLAARLATPTPPQGVPPLVSTAEAPSLTRTPSPAPQRPVAPDIRFSRDDESPPADDQSACVLCGSRNQRGLRFCVTCGHLLAQRPSAVPGGNAAVPSKSRAPPAIQAPPIAPSRVLQLGDPSPPVPEARICTRCHGMVEGAGQFCRFCGASLADAAPMDVRSPPPAGSVTVRPSTGSPTTSTSTVAIFAPNNPRVRLVLIARDGGEGPSYAVGETTDIGRTEGHVVIGDDHYISPRHARISMRDGAYFLRDLGTANGVYLRIPFSVDGLRETAPDPEQELGDQELFLVGQQVLRFEVVKHAEEGFGVASDNGTLLFGTPTASRYARLSQRTVEGVVRDVFHIRKTETVIGRESGDIVFTDDPFLSRRHAVVRVRTGPSSSKSARRFTLADLGSSNGTFLQVRAEVPLRPGDHFRIGQQLFRFEVDVNRAGA
jgi:pSer/pThr/pTyr-binding forkhead associated (FHA) protein